MGKNILFLPPLRPSRGQAGNRSLRMFYVYAIQSEKDGRIYVGMTKDIEIRLKEHNSGKTRSTKRYMPWRLIYKEACNDRVQARKREKYFKSGIGKKTLKEIYRMKAS